MRKKSAKSESACGHEGHSQTAEIVKRIVNSEGL